MVWKATGRPTVRQQRDKWVVGVDGFDTETGKVRLDNCALSSRNDRRTRRRSN